MQRQKKEKESVTSQGVSLAFISLSIWHRWTVEMVQMVKWYYVNLLFYIQSED